jgi:hypothetical protein
MGIIGGIAYSPRNFGDDIIHHYPEQLKDNPQPLHPPHGHHSLERFENLFIYVRSRVREFPPDVIGFIISKPMKPLLLGIITLDRTSGQYRLKKEKQ